MTRSDSESMLPTPDPDPHDFLFGEADAEDPNDRARPPRRERRRTEGAGRRRRGRLFVVLALVLIAAVAYLVVPRVVDYFRTADYTGQGTGQVTVTIKSGATASDIGNLLHAEGVVRSSAAFTDAANADSRSQSIQPGVYVLRKHMAGSSALALLLDPASRNAAGDLVVPEGATVLDVEQRLVTIVGASRSAAVARAIKSGSELGLPLKYTGSGTGVPTSAEGFLFPATYTVDPGVSPQKVLQAMVVRYLQQDRQTSFADDAAASNLTPYQALTIASIAQAEAKFPQDMPRVARTILNRIKIGRPLQFDSTSSYGAKLQGLDPTKVTYATLDSPYNTYTHQGLPPTPIDNPGADAMQAAATPAAGDYLYFVNKDKAGHLLFTSSEKVFLAAAKKCRDNNWGCG